MQKSSHQRQRWAIVVLAFIWLITTTSASGQFRMSGGVPVLAEEGVANIFIRLESGVTADGFQVDLPLSWQVLDVRLVRKSGALEGIQVQMRADGGIVGYTDASFTSKDHLILTVKTGNIRGDLPVITFTPVSRDMTSGLTGMGRPLQVAVPLTEKSRPSGNLGIDFQGVEAPAVIRADKIPRMAFDESFTVEFWVRATGLDQVLISTWNGAEGDPYPLEIVIDSFGHLTAFQGTGTAHVSVRSNVPVSDGSWHHVALAYEAQDRWTRLMIDGAKADSLRLHMIIPSLRVSDLMVGGRAAGSDFAFTGHLDELRIWSKARTPFQIRTAMKNPFPDMGDEDFSVTFDEESPDPAFSGLKRIDTGLSFLKPLKKVDIVLESEGVRIEWQGQDPSVVAYIVERSSDGRRFEMLSRVPAGNGAFLASPIEYVDRGVSEGVWYYRIQQVRPGSSGDYSRTMKIGMGAEENDRSAALTGNFPNPFNPNTVITYEVRETQPVHVSVWDLAGQQIAILVDGIIAAGNHEVSFYAADLPSGTYFVRLRSNDGTQIRQIVLMK